MATTDATEVVEGDELRDTDSGNVLVVTEERVNGLRVEVWSDDGRLQHTRSMSAEHLSDALRDGELQRL